MAMLRIIRTVINVEFAGVSEPIVAFVIREGKVRQLLPDEMTVNLEAVAKWEQDEQERFYADKL